MTFGLAVFSCAAPAEHQGPPPGWVETGTTLIAAATTAGELERPGLLAFDIAAGLPVRTGQLSLLIEAETSSYLVTESTLFPNAIHGAQPSSATSTGQLRISEFRYDFSGNSGEWSLGFIDSKSHIDTSVVANDDKTQFSNPVFVNNPTIGLPQSSLGLFWQLPAVDSRPGYSLLLASNDRSGAFIAVEAWRAFAAMTVRVGAWDSGADLSLPVGRSTRDHEYGLYTAIDGHLATLNWNFRAGIAKPGSAAAQAFISMAAEIPLAGNTMGIAVGRSMRGDHWSIGGFGEERHVEVYYRHELSDGIAISPCIQFRNAVEFGSGVSALAAGLRFRLNI